MLRRLIAVTLITLSLLAGSFLLIESVTPAPSPTLYAEGGGGMPPPPIPPRA